LRVGINALFLLPGRVGGSEIYIRNLVKWLERVDDRNEYVVFVNKESAGVFTPVTAKMKVVSCPIRASSRPARILWEQIALPIQVKLHKLDILLSAGMTAPFFCPVRSILVIYDLQHVNMPENFTRLQLFFLKTIIYLSAKRANSLIAISNKVKDDIIRHYNIDGSGISVVYLAADTDIFRPASAADIESVRKRYDLPARFILYTASSLPHKNYERLLEAYKKVRDAGSTRGAGSSRGADSTRGQGEGVKLVLIGARDYGHGVIAEKISELGLEADVLFLGWLPFEDVASIYSAATAFVFPSLHEGFGLPVLEAFASGVPVVCSKIAPVTEVAGDAALLVDPLSVDAIAKGISRVLTEDGLRKRLVSAGLARAAAFSWEKTALGTIKTFYPEAEKNAP
jgi:glycosyltransferase involved in cell wall biosynthesis